jgi:uncharacterized protein (TIGR00290 family)
MEKTEKMNAFVSWSGEKNAALSCYRAMKDFNVTCLLNMIIEDEGMSWPYGPQENILKMQAEAMDIPIIQAKSSWENYETAFRKVLRSLKSKGVEAGIFWDIDIEEHKEWMEIVCGEEGIKAFLPLWGEKKKETLMRELVEAGFEAIVVSVTEGLLEPDWLGRCIDLDFIEKISKIEGVDIYGDRGEYHTLVVSGPIFKKRINILKSENISHNGQCFLNILKCELADK